MLFEHHRLDKVLPVHSKKGLALDLRENLWELILELPYKDVLLLLQTTKKTVQGVASLLLVFRHTENRDSLDHLTLLIFELKFIQQDLCTVRANLELIFFD